MDRCDVSSRANTGSGRIYGQPIRRFARDLREFGDHPSQAMLDRLARSEFKYVKELVAKDPNTSLETLRYLHRHAAPGSILYSIAEKSLLRKERETPFG